MSLETHIKGEEVSMIDWKLRDIVRLQPYRSKVSIDRGVLKL